jgi:hypothetical protein
MVRRTSSGGGSGGGRGALCPGSSWKKKTMQCLSYLSRLSLRVCPLQQTKPKSGGGVGWPRGRSRGFLSGYHKRTNDDGEKHAGRRRGRQWPLPGRAKAFIVCLALVADGALGERLPVAQDGLVGGVARVGRVVHVEAVCGVWGFSQGGAVSRRSSRRSFSGRPLSFFCCARASLSVRHETAPRY